MFQSTRNIFLNAFIKKNKTENFHNAINWIYKRAFAYLYIHHCTYYK